MVDVLAQGVHKAPGRRYLYENCSLDFYLRLVTEMASDLMGCELNQAKQ